MGNKKNNNKNNQEIETYKYKNPLKHRKKKFIRLHKVVFQTFWQSNVSHNCNENAFFSHLTRMTWHEEHSVQVIAKGETIEEGENPAFITQHHIMEIQTIRNCVLSHFWNIASTVFCTKYFIKNKTCTLTHHRLLEIYLKYIW